jgi:three-Cys-motif partner protein
VPETTTWPLPPHSAAKHLLLRKYLEVWYAKLAFAGVKRGSGQLNYIDAFAGPGIYDGGEPGSPIVALRTLLDHRGFPQWRDVKFLLYFVEEKPDRCLSLEEQVSKVWSRRSSGKPSNVEVVIKNTSFYDSITDLTSISEARGKPFQVPTFAFVDPFGFKELPVAALCSLLRSGPCEVLFNFMYDPVNHWATAPNEKHQESMRLLFGDDEHLSVEGLPPKDRERILHELFERVFRDHGNFEYVRRFQMEGLKARTLYSLYFATHSVVGLGVMKDVMWKIDPAEGRRFSDRMVDQPRLFEGEPDLDKLRGQVFDHFAGTWASIEDVEKFVIVDTDFHTKHLRKGVLVVLENANLITLPNASPSRRRGTYGDGSIIRFSALDG